MPRVMEITTPLGKDVLLFRRMHAREQLSVLSEYQVELLSDKGDIDPDKILGKNVTVKLELPEDKTRCFNGFVTRFAQTGMHGRYHTYQATVRPWLWFLTRTSNCRIFQDLTAPDIIKQIFDDHPQIADVKNELSGTYRKREYCVQYRESDCNFVCRLMEEEGIYFYFKHKDGQHTLVLADSYGAHSTYDGYAEVSFVPQDQSPRPELERISEWHFGREIQSGRYVIDDFDFKKPSVELQVKTKVKREHELSDLEVYDYPGEYVTAGEGDHYVKTRIEEIQAQWELAQGTSNARGISVGYLFKLTGQNRKDQNREYLVIAASYHLENNEYEAIENAGANYDCHFVALNSRQAFRPLRATPRPTVQGPQTAIVVGPSGDEIYTDKYGRVKVQFHWDRKGKKDENSSCWIRVAHPWAGKNWGMVAIPRIGQEVIVDFLEGDPDQPIITGRVYNAEQMPPWDLPANMTQTGALTRSTKSGSAANANAIRFEDKKDSEQLWIHAEKNQDIEVENDETHWVGHDRKKTIDNDETTHVKHDRTETVDNNEKITIGVNRTEQVGVNETIDIGANRSITVGANETATVVAQRTHTVGINETITVGAAQEITIGAAQVLTVGADQTVNIGVNQGESIGSNRSIDVGKDDSLSVSKNLTITAGDSITITTGSASISMKKDGTIVIKGKDITVDGSGKINIKANSDIVMKGSKILQN